MSRPTCPHPGARPGDRVITQGGTRAGEPEVFGR
jgi:hypothetical protein